MLCPSVYSVTIDGIGVKKQCSELAHLSWIIYRNTTTAAASPHSPETVPLTRAQSVKEATWCPQLLRERRSLLLVMNPPVSITYVQVRYVISSNTRCFFASLYLHLFSSFFSVLFNFKYKYIHCNTFTYFSFFFSN